MTLAQKVAAEYRERAESLSDRHLSRKAELNAIADVVEAGDAMLDMDSEDAAMANRLAHDWTTALAKLAEAVGVEGE